jgi:hypothetical protein
MSEAEEVERSEVHAYGSTSHNNRVTQIKRFIMFPPAEALGAELLRLAVAGTTGEILCMYTRAQCVEDKGRIIPDTVSLELERHVNNVQRECQAVLAWCRHDGSTVITKQLRARPDRSNAVLPIPGMTLEESAALVGEADSRAVVGQLIRSSEVFLRSHLQGHHNTLTQSRELADTALEQAKTSGSMAMQMFEQSMGLMKQVQELQAEAASWKTRAEAAEKQLADIAAAAAIEDGDTSNITPEEAEARTQLVNEVTTIVRDKVGPLVPEAWGMLKMYLMRQAAAQHQARAAQSQANGAANGAANGHAPD